MSHGNLVESESVFSPGTLEHGATGPGLSGATSSTQQSEPAVIGISGTNEEPTNLAGENERVQLLETLESIVDKYRRGESSKAEAVSNVVQTLRQNAYVSLTEQQKDTALDSYLAELSTIPSRSDDPTSQNNQPTVSGKHGSVKRAPDPDSSDDDEGDDKPSKRQKLLESDMPWYVENEQHSRGSLHPSCDETRRLLRAYNRDITKSKFFVKIAPNSPPGIPSSQWERIFRGDAVDLNQIYASLHHVIPDEERTGRVGDTEISFALSETKKRVRTASEWSSAWRRASRAITFAFPHRRDELLEYGDYIEGEFAAKLTSSHHRVILYDSALRNEVGGGQHCLLMDSHKFSRLYSAIVMPDGVETQHGSGGKNKKSSGTNQDASKSEICNKFNNGTCKNADADCKYRHACKGCKKPGHGKKDCPGKAD